MAEENGFPKHGYDADAKRRQKFKDRSRGLSAPLLLSPDTKAPLPFSTLETARGLGHQFAKKTFFQPTFCHHCTELLWGLKHQGLKCPGLYEIQYNSHIAFCSYIQPLLIVNSGCQVYWVMHTLSQTLECNKCVTWEVAAS